MRLPRFRTRRALAAERLSGLRPVRGGLWVWRGPGWQYGPDTPERRASAVPIDPCPHADTTEVPGGRLCVSCCRVVPPDEAP